MTKLGEDLNVIFDDVNLAKEAFMQKEHMYKYCKNAKDFGRIFFLETDGPFEVFHELPKPELLDNFKTIDLCEIYTQTDKSVAETASQTPKKVLLKRVMEHKEGGFSQTVNVNKKEDVTRYKMSLEDDSKSTAEVPEGIEIMAGHVLSSTFVDMYSFPLEEEPEDEDFGELYFHIYATLEDPLKLKRPIVDICWDPNNVEVLAAAYCNHRALPGEQYDGREAYIWNTRNRMIPFLKLDGGSPITAIDFDTVNIHAVAATSMEGQVCIFDIRAGSLPVCITPKFTFHDTPTCVQWTNPLVGNELAAGALDGQIIWYDLRNWKEPLDKVLMDVTKGETPRSDRALGVTSFHYDIKVPTKYYVGTEKGVVVIGDRKGKSQDEKVGKNVIHCHQGPVNNVYRNPQFLKYFFTVGDWLLKIWSDDYLLTPIFWTNYDDSLITTAAWSKVKNSLILVGKENGSLDIWDFLEKGIGPIKNLKVSESPIRRVKINDGGQFSAAGGDDGCLYLMRWSRHFGVFTDEDMSHCATWLEREVRREKALENKLKEKRLKGSKLLQQPSIVDDTQQAQFEAEAIKRANAHFKKTVDDVVFKRGVNLGFWGRLEEEET